MIVKRNPVKIGTGHYRVCNVNVGRVHVNMIKLTCDTKKDI